MLVTFRFWLRQNFLRRGLRWLGQRQQSRLFGSLRLPSLLPRCPVIVRENAADEFDEATDARIVINGLEARVLSSAALSLKPKYVEWIAPLAAGSESFDAMSRLAESLPGFRRTGQHFFSARDYLESMQVMLALDAEVAHLCRAKKYFFSSSGSPTGNSPSLRLVDRDALLVFARSTQHSNARAARR